MKKIILIIMLMLCAGSVYSQWTANYGYSTGDINFSNAKGNAIVTDSYGYSYVTGYTFDESTQNDIVTIKYSSTGDTLWARTFNGDANLNDEGFGICVDAGGNIYVVGYAQFSGKSSDVVILKYSSEGTLDWVNQYSSATAALDDKGLAIAVDGDGYIYVTGYTTNTDDKKDIFVNKYSSTGVLWTVLEDGPADDNSEGSCITVDSEGNVYVGGYVTSAEGNADIAVVKFNSSGTRDWIRTTEGSGNGEDKAWGIVVDEDDNIYISGSINESGEGSNTYTAKMNSEGTLIWESKYNSSSNGEDKAWGLVVDEDGSVYITGETYDTESSTQNYITAKYSNNGTSVWMSFYNGTGNGEDIATAIALVQDNVVVTGKSWGTSSNYDYATVRYDKTDGTQNQLNRYSYTGNSNDFPKDISTDGSAVLITGFSDLTIENHSAGSFISTISLNWGSELVSEPVTPKSFSLHQNYPNPFNPSTSIKFDLKDAAVVKLAVYDMLGRQVDVLINQQLDAGEHTISFNAGSLSSGVYFYMLEAGSFRDIKKMTLVK